MNIVAGVLILIASTILGISINNMYLARVKIAEELYKYVGFTQSEISFFRTGITEMNEKYAKTNKNDFTRLLSGGMVHNVAQSTVKLLNDFTDGLAKLDLASQKDFTNTYLSFVNEEIAALKKESEVKGKLFKRLSPVLGIAVFIMVL